MLRPITYAPAHHRLRATRRAIADAPMLLIGATVVALGWANSPLSQSYESLRSFTFGPAVLYLDLPLEAWAADGLLAVFFFIIGNELKQELIHGELRDSRRALLPIVAALGGAALPAAVFPLAIGPREVGSIDNWTVVVECVLHESSRRYCGLD